MMTLPQYRSSVEYKEILRLLQKSTEEVKNFVWQTSEERRVVVDIDHLDIDFVSREVVLTLKDKNLALAGSLPLYVKLEHRSSVFKVVNFKVGQRGELHFSFPQEIKTLELRQYPRVNFADKDKIISVKPSLGLPKDSGNSLNVRVLDMSDYGFGLVISEQNKAFIKNNPLLWITHLDKNQLRYPVLAEVVHISSEGTGKKKEVKVGLKLSGVIQKDLITKFLL